MSLVTRCPACGTHFRVVADQLRISEGWVRCGRCEEVFDASLQLLPPALDSKSEASQSGVTSPAHTTPVSASDSALAADDGLGAEPEPEPLGVQPDAPESVDSAELNLIFPDTVQMPSEAGWNVSVPDRPSLPSLDYGDGQTSELAGQTVAHEGREDLEAGLSALPESTAKKYGLSATLAAEPEPEPEGNFGQHLAAAMAEPQAATSDPDAWLASAPGPLPAMETDPASVSFLRAQSAAAQPQSAWIMPVQWFILACLVVVFAQQVVRHFRDELASAFPVARPALTMLCDLTGCEVQALRRIEAVVIESSNFSKATAGSYRLQLSLRNNAEIPVAVPALEMVLTDFHDQPMLRRVFAAKELDLNTQVLLPGQSLALQLPLRVLPPAQPERVTGYRLIAFYP